MDNLKDLFKDIKDGLTGVQEKADYLTHVNHAMYENALEKTKQIRALQCEIAEIRSKAAEYLARTEANKEKIETTSEGRSFLKGRYNYWYTLLGGVIK